MFKFAVVFCVICLELCGQSSIPEDVIARRQAFRRDLENHPEKAKLYLQSPDEEIRRYALYRIAKEKGKTAKEDLKKALKDPDEKVRLTAIRALLHFFKYDADVQKILQQTVSGDKNREIVQLVKNAAWPFHRNVILIRNDANWDHAVEVVKKFEIPDGTWKFKLDPKETGHSQKSKWYREKLSDAGWASIRLGPWEEQGYNYDGVAWYRIRFNMPEKIDCNAVELAFSGVDESAWVWLNGTYLGCHDLGPIGWNVPFSLDCTKEVRWGKENVMVVRVLDTAQDGGIYKPIHVEILK